MPIELACDPVLSDSDILDCVAQTPFEPESRTNYLIALGRAIEAKTLDAMKKGGAHADGISVAEVSTEGRDSVTNAQWHHSAARANAGY